MGLLKLLFSFKGRINRAQYWLGTTGAGVLGALLFFMLATMTGPDGGDDKTKAAAGAAGALGLTLLPVMAVSTWIGLALQVKRFHDRGRTGWFVLAPVVPIVMMASTVIGGAMSGQPFGHVAASGMGWLLLLWAIQFAFFIDLGCLAGKDGPNRYGDPPGSGSLPPSAPIAPPAPGQSVTASLFGAQKAMDRAIAEQARKQQQQPVEQPRPAPQSAYAAAGAPGATPSFGRRAAR